MGKEHGKWKLSNLFEIWPEQSPPWKLKFSKIYSFKHCPFFSNLWGISEHRHTLPLVASALFARSVIPSWAVDSLNLTLSPTDCSNFILNFSGHVNNFHSCLTHKLCGTVRNEKQREQYLRSDWFCVFMSQIGQYICLPLVLYSACVTCRCLFMADGESTEKQTIVAALISNEQSNAILCQIRKTLMQLMHF